MSHDIPPVVRSWLDDTLAEAPKPDRVAETVATLIHQTPQQRGWLPPLGEGRSRMFAAITSLAAVAALAVAGGLLLTPQESGDTPSVGVSASPSPSPSASLDPMRPAWVTGTLNGGEPIGTQSGLFHTTGVSIEMSDPRLSGTLSQVFTVVKHPVVGDDTIRVFTGEYRIENEGGSWEGSNLGMERGAGPWDTVTDTGVLVGSGDYEGLTAYLMFDWSILSPPYEVTGAIFPGELPPVVTFEELPEE